MATSRAQGDTCRIVQDRILTLESTDRHEPDYEGIVVMKEKILVVDSNIRACNLQMYNRLDGRRIFASSKMGGQPRDVCVIRDTEMAVCLHEGKIVIMSLDSIIKPVKTFDLRTGSTFVCQSVAKWRSDELIVSGWKSNSNSDSKLCWGLVSVTDNGFVSTHDICKVKYSGSTHVAVKNNTVYVSCFTTDANTDGVYAFDVLNLNHKPKFLYQHNELKVPWTIMVDSDYVYVCNKYSNEIHQVSGSGKLLAIHKLSSGVEGMFYDEKHGDLYTTSYNSNELTLYKMLYPQAEALEDGEETVHSIHVIVVGSIGAGKSTLIKHLLGSDVNICEIHSTEAIDINCCDVSLSTGAWRRQTNDLGHCVKKEVGDEVKDSGKHLFLTIWDIPGQCALYAAHQTLLTRQAIYLLVFDVSLPCKVHELLEVWLNSLHSCTSSQDVIPSMILVGTHVDKLSKDERDEICMRCFGEIHSYLKDKPTRLHLINEDFSIDNTVVDSNMEDLKRKIVQVASQEPYWGEKTPARWIPLQQELMRQKANGVKVISHDDVMKINKEQAVQIEPKEKLVQFLSFLHETGVIIYGSTEKLKRTIVLDPRWILINYTHSDSPPVGVSAQKWADFTEKGLLSSDVIDAILTKENYPDLHQYKDEMLRNMEQNNIIAKPSAFTENGKILIEDYFLVPSMLHKEAPREIISPEQNPMIVSTPFLCFVFKEKILPPSIFHRLTAACITRWPVAKKKETLEHLMFNDCSIFNLDLFHRLILHCEHHDVFVRITRFVDGEAQTPDLKLCSRARRFINLSLPKFISYLGQNIPYDLHSCTSPEDGISAPFQWWFTDEDHEPDALIKPAHMNYARISIALVTICASALRDVLLNHVPDKDINKRILHCKSELKKKLQGFQVNHVFPDPVSKSKKVGNVEQFDISLLYALIQYISTVDKKGTKWGVKPDDDPRDRTIRANVDRIRLYRNQFGHSGDAELKQEEFQKYWERIEAVLVDLEAEQALGKQNYKEQLEKQKKQVISVYEA